MSKLRFHVILRCRFPAGESIEVAADALVAIANQNHCFAEADFNGCNLMAGPEEHPSDLVAIYERFRMVPLARTVDDEVRGHT